MGVARDRRGGETPCAAPAGPWHIWVLAALGLAIISVVLVAAALIIGPATLPFPVIVTVVALAALAWLDLLLALLSSVLRKDLRMVRRGTCQLRLALRLALVGRCFTRTDRDRLFRSFVLANNRLLQAVLRGKKRRRGPPRLLLLAPTCLQAGDCAKEITKDASLCERCGNCPVKDLVELAEERGLELHFVAGGTLARSLVETRAPDAIVAVACERELTEGILFSRKVPVLAIPNTRPKGPCKETQVDVAEVREAVEALRA